MVFSCFGEQALSLSVRNPSSCCLLPFHLVLCRSCFKPMSVFRILPKLGLNIQQPVAQKSSIHQMFEIFAPQTFVNQVWGSFFNEWGSNTIVSFYENLSPTVLMVKDGVPFIREVSTLQAEIIFTEVGSSFSAQKLRCSVQENLGFQLLMQADVDVHPVREV